MKVTLDLGRLLSDGKIDQPEYDRLLALAHRATGTLAFNILVAFGVVAVASGALLLVPDPMTAVVLGLAALGGGLGVKAMVSKDWRLLSHILIVVGALMFGGGIVKLGEGSIAAFGALAGMFLLAGVLARSSFLIALAVLALSSMIGARTGYLHAMYFLGVQEPALTVLAFSALALGTYLLSKRLPAADQGLALTAARTSLFLVNFAFWIGSLWGDRLALLRNAFEPGSVTYATRALITDWQFAIAWAVALGGVAVWAATANRRFVVNLAAVFGGIHFYTQWFERLGATPVSVLIAGLTVLAFAGGLWRLNASLREA
jgi:iron complex transport system permease protein